MDEINLYWHDYRYFPYERVLAEREAASLLAPMQLQETPYGLQAIGNARQEKLDRLVYFRSYSFGSTFRPTLQHEFEKSMVNGGSYRKQATRYSVHGLHDYKGKFNPQIVRGILNILAVEGDTAVFDPFCGSGTTLVECAHTKLIAMGCDINPLAVYLSNAKLKALATSATRLGEAHKATLAAMMDRNAAGRFDGNAINEQRLEYLRRWFDTEILGQLERLRSIIEQIAPDEKDVLFALASDLVRDYSLQDPDDLRVRRRRTPLPTKSFLAAYDEKVHQFLANLRGVQRIIGILPLQCSAHVFDSRHLHKEYEQLPIKSKFDIAITSPPYATALPYIDTQRLSLIWLDLCGPQELASLEATLTGSREFRQADKSEWQDYLLQNRLDLPHHVHEFCMMLEEQLSTGDGFRRQAVPRLLYRYFSDMQAVFRGVRCVLKRGATFALVVGHNHTTLGDKRYDIDTPALLKEIAVMCGWSHIESIPLQTYQRYGMHNANAVRHETLLILSHHD